MFAACCAAAVAALIGYSLLAPQPAPAVTFKTLSGQMVTSQSLRGQVVLVNFWATSCSTCMQEMPMLVRTFQKYQGRGFNTVAVAMQYDPVSYVVQYAQTRKLPFLVAHDTDARLAQSFDNVQLTPTSFVIDKHGNIAKRFVGQPAEGELAALIEGLLAAS